MDTDPLSQLSTALDVTGQMIGAIHGEQWAARTPCSDWNVCDLVGHVVAGNVLFASALAGECTAYGGPARARPGRQALALAAAYRDSAAALLAAFGQPGALERPVRVPFGSVPGVTALHMRITELLVHGWDLARATGQQPAFPADLAEQELAFALGELAGEQPGPSPAGAPQRVPAGAPAIEQLAACLGRDIARAR